MAVLPSSLSSTLPESKRISLGSTNNMRPLRTVTLIWPASTIERSFSARLLNIASRASDAALAFSNSASFLCKASFSSWVPVPHALNLLAAALASASFLLRSSFCAFSLAFSSCWSFKSF